MAAILDSGITKMPSGCNHYTHLIRKLHGTETPKMQRKDCYQTLQGELPRSLKRQQWPTLRYQFLFYHDSTKIMLNKQILSIQMLKIAQKLSPGYSMVTSAHLGVR